MAEASGQGGGSHRDATRPRQRVQQLRPTNKDVPVPAPAAQVSAPDRTAAVASRGDTNASSSTSIASAPPRAVIPRIVTGQGSGSTIIVNNCQRGNPILQHIRNVGWEYGDIVPDYQVGVANCVLFLSLRYHRLHPEYIHSRIQKMSQMYTLRILLVMCDVDQHQSAIKELTKVALINNLTMMVAWTAEEAGTYIERYKSFEHKAPDLIRERVNDDYMSHLGSALTSIKGVNKTDVITLATNFGSFKRIVNASSDDLGQLPGFGATKVKRIRDIFSQPFRVGETRTGRERREERQRMNGGDLPSPSSSASRGRFIRDEEDQQVLAEHEQEQGSGRLSVTPGPAHSIDPATYVKPKVNGTKTAASDSVLVEEEDVEDADDWDIMDGMTEEEKLQLALEMSISVDLDEDDA
ncbi:hypothetical protein CBS101457_000581 [Exobasidium rhododendri]|nr:hypothetical protein CBS101457_000581 [Exobasidium rhododendri]